MIYPNEPFYVVGELGLGREGFGSYGFSIGLKPEFARRFYEETLSDEIFVRMDKLGREIVKEILGFELHENPYNFFHNKKGERTFLLKGCQTFGNSCDLSIDGSEISNLEILFDPEFLIEYQPHNVDSKMNALSLFTLWNQWAIDAYAATS